MKNVNYHIIKKWVQPGPLGPPGYVEPPPDPSLLILPLTRRDLNGNGPDPPLYRGVGRAEEDLDPDEPNDEPNDDDEGVDDAPDGEDPEEAVDAAAANNLI